MYVKSRSRAVRQAAVVETVTTSFRGREPFSFLANPNPGRGGWTPTSLFEKKGITRFGKLVHVSLFVTTANFDRVLGLVEAWLEAGVPVVLKCPPLRVRPRVGDHADPTFAGIDTEDCYPLGEGGFVASPRLRAAFLDSFDGDPMVTLQ